MDKAFIIGCWLVMATVVAVFVICTLLNHRQFNLHVCGATVPEGLPDLLQATLLPGHSITVTQRFYLNQFRKDCHIGRFQPLPDCCTTEHWRLVYNATGRELTPISDSEPHSSQEES